MLIRHSFYYLLARGAPGVINFAALALYTRLLAPAEFGRYALIVAGVGLAQVILFQWLKLVIARYLPGYGEQPERFLGAIMALFLWLALIATGLGLALAVLWPDPVWRGLLALAVPLLLAQAWFQCNLTVAATRLAPGLYGRLLASKASLALLIGGTLAWLGVGAYAPLIGLISGHLLALLLFGLAAWNGVRPRNPGSGLLRRQLAYGLPLTVTYALGWVVSSSDRLLIAWLLDDGAVGVYAVGYDLAQHSLGLLLAIVSTAAYPLAVHALERRGPAAAKAQLARNGALIISVAFAGAAGLAVLAPQLVSLLVGDAFRTGAVQILPWVALAAALAGLKSLHIDIAFHLGAQTRQLLASATLAALVNVALNLLLIPSHGILGAAWATAAAFGLAALASLWLSRGVFDMPALLPLLARGSLVAAAAAAAAALGSRWGSGLPALGAGLTLGCAAAAAVALAINLAGLREAACVRWRRLAAGVGRSLS